MCWWWCSNVLSLDFLLSWLLFPKLPCGNGLKILLLDEDLTLAFTDLVSEDVLSLLLLLGVGNLGLSASNLV